MAESLFTFFFFILMHIVIAYCWVRTLTRSTGAEVARLRRRVEQIDGLVQTQHNGGITVSERLGKLVDENVGPRLKSLEDGRVQLDEVVRQRLHEAETRFQKRLENTVDIGRYDETVDKLFKIYDKMGAAVDGLRDADTKREAIDQRKLQIVKASLLSLVQEKIDAVSARGQKNFDGFKADFAAGIESYHRNSRLMEDVCSKIEKELQELKADVEKDTISKQSSRSILALAAEEKRRRKEIEKQKSDFLAWAESYASEKIHEVVEEKIRKFETEHRAEVDAEFDEVKEDRERLQEQLDDLQSKFDERKEGYENWAKGYASFIIDEAMIEKKRCDAELRAECDAALDGAEDGRRELEKQAQSLQRQLDETKQLTEEEIANLRSKVLECSEGQDSNKKAIWEIEAELLINSNTSGAATHRKRRIDSTLSALEEQVSRLSTEHDEFQRRLPQYTSQFKDLADAVEELKREFGINAGATARTQSHLRQSLMEISKDINQRLEDLREDIAAVCAEIITDTVMNISHSSKEGLAGHKKEISELTGKIEALRHELRMRFVALGAAPLQDAQSSAKDGGM